MERTEKLLHRVEIESLVAEFAYRIDHGDYEAVADLFTTDGSLGMKGEPSCHGRDVIRGVYQSVAHRARRRTTRHLFSNLRVKVHSDTAARSTSVLTLYAGNSQRVLRPKPVLVHEFEDTYRFCDGLWLFESRQCTPLYDNGLDGNGPRCTQQAVGF